MDHFFINYFTKLVDEYDFFGSVVLNLQLLFPEKCVMFIKMYLFVEFTLFTPF